MQPNPLLQQTGRTLRWWPRCATYCGRQLSSSLVSLSSNERGAASLRMAEESASRSFCCLAGGLSSGSWRAAAPQHE